MADPDAMGDPDLVLAGVVAAPHHIAMADPDAMGDPAFTLHGAVADPHCVVARGDAAAMALLDAMGGGAPVAIEFLAAPLLLSHCLGTPLPIVEERGAVLSGSSTPSLLVLIWFSVLRRNLFRLWSRSAPARYARVVALERVKPPPDKFPPLCVLIFSW